MDADDYIEKNMYKIMIAQMESDSTLDVGVCLWNFIDQNGKKVVNKENISFSAYGKQTGRDFLKHIYDDSYTNGIVVSPWNKIFKRECIVKHKMVGRYAEDDYLMSKVFSNDDCRIVVIKEILYNYCENDDQMTKKEDNINKLFFLDVLKERELLFSYSDELVFKTQKLYVEMCIEYYSTFHCKADMERYITILKKYLCKLLRDNRVKVSTRIRVIHIPNGGVSNARNIGLDMAEGEYITFIDADDRVTEGYLENLYDCITNSKADMVISGYKKVWEDSDKVEISSMNILGLVEMDDILPYFAKWQKETGIFGYCWGKVFSRELCQGIYFDTSIRLAEDFDFYLKLYRRVKTIYFDNKHNYLYLQEAQNSSVAKSDYEIDYVAQLKINLRYKEFLELKNFFEGNNQKILLEKISNYFYFSLFYCDLNNFEKVFDSLYKIYSDIKINFVTKGFFPKTLLFLLRHNRKKEIKYLMGMRRCVRRIK